MRDSRDNSGDGDKDQRLGIVFSNIRQREHQRVSFELGRFRRRAEGYEPWKRGLMGAADIWRERAIRDELASERRAAMRRERARLAAREETSKSEKREDADRLLKIREGDVAKGLPISPKIGRLKFDDAAADLLTDYKVNGRRAVEHVKRRIKKGLTPYFGGWRMANITTADIRK